MSTMLQAKQLFQQPPAMFRSVPFWAWNDTLDEEEIVRQIQGMKEQGVGGFFMHSRDGLETPYMGEQWFRCVRAAVDAAAEHGMQAWIYDEDRWPSGTAGGMVPAMGDAYRAKGLTVEVIQGELAAAEAIVALFRGVIDGLELLRCERIAYEPGQRYAAEDGEVLLVFRIEVSAPSEWFNGESPSDSLNPDAIQAFIAATHEVYKREIGEQFGKAVAGVFTDEPSSGDRHCQFSEGRGWIPWTYTLPAFFQERRGFDVYELLPYIFFLGEHSAAIRHDYWRTVSDMFSESFSKQLGEWCEANEVAFTGHFLWENSLGVATRVCGAIMPNYRFQHVPGVDLLMEQVDETITMKQCTSVANQYGRKQVISETYGCTGWDFTFEGQKWLGDFQYVMGVNVRSQHLALYSLKGCRKRDYPPVFNYNTNWWQYNHVVEDYFARLGAVLSEGTVKRDILVLHPASTAWMMFGANPYGMPARSRDPHVLEVSAYGEKFNTFLRYMLGEHYDFDLGDETIISETGRVEGGSFVVNLAKYKAVVIPPMQTLLASTVELLRTFLEDGGQVIAVEPVPYMVEGRYSDELQGLYVYDGMKVVKREVEVVAALEPWLPRDVSVRNAQGLEAPEILYMLREQADGWVLFVVNNDRDQAMDVVIDVAAMGHVEECELLTGGIQEIQVKLQGQHVIINTHLGPAGSRLYLISKEKVPMNTAVIESINGGQVKKSYTSLSAVAGFTRTMPNLLVLDRCRYRLHNGDWSEVMDVWQAQREVRDQLGMRQVYANGITQRYKWIDQPHEHDGAPLVLKFTFEMKELPKEHIRLVLEMADHFRIQVNGQEVTQHVDGWLLDRSFQTVPLLGLRVGMNELVLYCDYMNRYELEDCYLIGHFGVDGQRCIGREPETLQLGDWCDQGYTHYCGSIIYYFDYTYEVTSDQRAFLELGEYSAVTLNIRVNGQAAGDVPWRAVNGVEITSFLQSGTNRIDIEVVGSPRNMLGPFHQAGGKTASTSWASFRTEGVEYVHSYAVQPYGLFDPIGVYLTI